MNGRYRRPALGWLAGSGAVLVGAGAVMYVLPGPGSLGLAAGVVLLLMAAVLRLFARDGR